MAIFIPGVAVSQVSGRVGGTIFSRNRGGQYMRNGSKPSIVTTPYAQAVKAILANFSAQWRELTAQQQEAWKEWATQNPFTNRLGQSRTLSGHQAFVKLNSRLSSAGGSTITMPPTGVAPEAVIVDTITYTATPEALTVAFAASPTPANVAVQVYAYVSDSTGVSYVKNKLALVYTSTDEAQSPLDILTPVKNRFGTLSSGQKIHIGLRTIDLTSGLVSTPSYGSQTI